MDTSRLYDGSLAVPVVVLAGWDDPLFPLPGSQVVADRLQAPSVDLVVFGTDCHLVLNEALDLALPAVLAGLDDLSPPAAAGPGSLQP